MCKMFACYIFREYLQTLLYLVEFERLHVPHTEETFKKCNKEGLVRGIFRNHSHKPQVGVWLHMRIAIFPDYE